MNRNQYPPCSITPCLHHDARLTHRLPSNHSAMSLDPFEVRLQFLQLLRKLNASQASIHKVVSFAVKYGSRCSEDLWECIIEECGKASRVSRFASASRRQDRVDWKGPC